MHTGRSWLSARSRLWGWSRGELIQVRESAGRYAILQAMLLTIERRGATPLLRCSAQIG